MTFPDRHAHWVALAWITTDCLLGFSYNWTGLEGRARHGWWYGATATSALMSWGLVVGCFGSVSGRVVRAWRVRFDTHRSVVVQACFLLGVCVLSVVGQWFLRQPDWEDTLVHVDIATWLRVLTGAAFVWAFVAVLARRSAARPAVALAALAFGALITLLSVAEMQLCRMLDPGGDEETLRNTSTCTRALGYDLGAWDNYTAAVVLAFALVLWLARRKKS